MSRDEMTEELQSHYEFELARKEVGITLKDEDGEDQHYVIREMDAGQRDSWFEKVNQRMRTNDKGESTGVRSFQGMQADLLALCMYHAERDGDEGEYVYTLDAKKPVKVSEAQKWPGAVQSKLFDLAQKVSGLDEAAKEKAKND